MEIIDSNPILKPPFLSKKSKTAKVYSLKGWEVGIFS